MTYRLASPPLREAAHTKAHAFLTRRYHLQFHNLNMKTFTTTGVCTKENNYMVDITDRLIKMKAMVDAGNYFTHYTNGIDSINLYLCRT